jgi:uncharacterized repeat protein (TIGR03806 family)
MPAGNKGLPRAAGCLAFGLIVAACGGNDHTQFTAPALEGPIGTQAFLSLPRELEGVQDVASLPKLLSETGVFADTALHEMAPGLLPYDVSVPLFSDGAQKQRWLALPQGTRVGFAEHGSFQFPVGTVLVKHFDMLLDERQPQHLTRLETRLLVAAAGGDYYAATYRWNAQATDAELVLEPSVEVLSIVDAQGKPREQSYTFPSPAQCMSCHTVSAGYVLGARTAQLNRSQRYRAEGPPENQLAVWARLELFEHPLDDKPLSAMPQLTPLDAPGVSAEQRLRSYWDANCSMCHASTSGIASAWDARAETPLVRQGILYGVPRRRSLDGAFIVTPGSPQYSLLYRRAVSVDAEMRMPPLGRGRVDEAYVDLLVDWITKLPPPRL